MISCCEIKWTYHDAYYMYAYIYIQNGHLTKNHMLKLLNYEKYWEYHVTVDGNSHAIS